jgi:hypothetical protein
MSYPPGFYEDDGEMVIDVEAILRDHGIPVTPETVADAAAKLAQAVRDALPGVEIVERD